MIRVLPEILQPFLAEAVLVLGCVALGLLSRSPRSRHVVSDFVLVVVAASAAAAVLSTTAAGTIGAMGGIEPSAVVVVDPLAAYLKFFLSMIALVVVWLSGRTRRPGSHATGLTRSTDEAPSSSSASPAGERVDGGLDEAAWAGFLLSLLGMQVMVSSVHAGVVWVASVLANLGLAQWVAGPRQGASAARGRASGLLLEGTLASAWVLLGFVLLFGLAGTLSYHGLGDRLPLSLSAPGGASMSFAAVALVLLGFGYWCAAVPWAHARVERAASLSLPASAWLQVGTTVVGLSILGRWIRMALTEPALEGAWQSAPGARWPALLTVVALATMTVGAAASVRESRLWRLVAWLLVAQIGYLLLGLVALSDKGMAAMLFQMAACAAATLGALVAVALVSEEAGDDDFEVLRGLARRRGTARLLAVALVVFVLSLAAVPPLAGFEGRSRLLAALVESGGWGTALMAAFNSGLLLLCGTRVVATVLDRPRDAEENVPIDFEAGTVVVGMLVLVLGLGLHPGPLSYLVERSVVFLAG